MNLRDVKKIRAAIVASEPDGSFNRNLTKSISRNIDNLFVDTQAFAGHALDPELFYDTELVTSQEAIETQFDETLYKIHQRVEKIQRTPIVEEVMKHVGK